MDFATIVRLLWAGLAVMVAGGVIWTLSRRHQDRVLERLRAEWGRLVYRDCDFPSLVDYHRARPPKTAPRSTTGRGPT